MRRFPKIITMFVLLIAISVLSLIPVSVAKAQVDEYWATIFYPNTSFENPAHFVSYEDSGLNINWGTGSPTNPSDGLALSGMPADNFSARFSTNKPFNAGIYEFTVIADGGVRLSVENNILFDELGNQGLASFSGIAFVGSGPAHLAIDYIEYTGNAVVQIDWEEVSSIVQAAPVPVFDPGVATAQVIGVDGLALRTGPYLGASLVAVLRQGETFTVTAQNNTEGVHTWYKLVSIPEGQTGWASGRYLEVDLQAITERSCALPAGNALVIAEQIVPGFSDLTLATQCLSTASAVLNSSVAGEITADELLNVTVECGPLLAGSTAPGRVLNFISDARLALSINNACTASGCTISDTLALEIALALAPDSVATTVEIVSCMNTVAEAFGGTVIISAATTLAFNCAGLLLGDTTISGILNFLDLVAPNLCTETSTPTIILPEESSIFENLIFLPDTGVTVAPRSVMNIRVRPGTRVASIGQLPWGTEAQLLARTIETSENHWYLIRYEGLIGWIDASFVNVRGNINDVPIY